jgi:hypothetical protein
MGTEMVVHYQPSDEQPNPLNRGGFFADRISPQDLN